MGSSRACKCVAAMGVAAVASLAFLLLAAPSPADAGDAPRGPGVVIGVDSAVYRFDPLSETYVFTYVLPSSGGCLRDVAVVSSGGAQNVWFTDPCRDRIGRLTYTDTTHYSSQEYALASDSRPLSIVEGGGYLWFTECGSDRIGRLDPSTGQVDEFTATVGSCPAGLDYASDGSIWFTEMEADKIAQLVVTSTTEYEVNEHYVAALAGGQPYGIVVVGGSVYFAQTANDRVTRFTPPSSWVHIHSLVEDIPDKPYELAVDGLNRVWATERDGNRLSQFEYGTFPVVNSYGLTPEGSVPSGIAADGSNRLWFTQWHAGQLGVLTPTVPSQKEYYPLPCPMLGPAGVAVDGSGVIWLVASGMHEAYLPLVIR
jgi:virginiamycin B lyase